MISDAVGRLYRIAKSYSSWVGSNLSNLAKWVGDVVSPPLVNGSDIPYSPPFTGGQCTDRQYVVAGSDIVSGGYSGSTSFSLTLQGAIGKPYKDGGNWYIPYQSGSNRVNRGGGSWYGIGFDVIGVNITSVTPVGGGADTCGDIPNPNPVTPPQDNPIPSGGNPVDTSGSLVSSGENPLSLDSLPTVDAAIPAATIGAIADAIGKVLGALKSLVDLANALKDLLDKLLKKEAKKELRVFGLGSVKGDGYLNFLPLVNQGWMPISVEVFVFQKPSYLSKWIGVRSPNYYNSGLGSISFVDSTFCVRDGRLPVNYIRSSFTAPSAAIGLYYHFGLTEKVSAQISILMEKNPP